ncbi:hypothetical protein [Nitrincola iocasae]|uniref:Uncharacterized protein n=1 Tax=Nitrincola iocasae TaxID=2614693 RepID=A0A5J6LGN9_9GAMM|nr:hypothetical protein [Nitrincola iocasae]QEW07361.1 hypothetical protein F5I99_13110 [Nitrincola iocasae]
MSSINDIVNSFNTGFFSTAIKSREPINLEVNKPEELADFKEVMRVVSTKSSTPPPPSKYVQLDGFTTGANGSLVPTKITLEGVYAHDSFYDENGKWDVEAEAYRERELVYKKEFINNWIKDNGYDEFHDTDILMKVLLAKTEL